MIKFACANVLLPLQMLLACIDIASSECQLSKTILPERIKQLTVGNKLLEIRISGSVSFFETTDGAVKITEGVTASLDNAENIISSYISTNADSLPKDKCGTQATFGRIRARVRADNLEIDTPLKVQQFGCLIGVQALVATGEFEFHTLIQPSMEGSKLRLTPTTTHTGSLESNVPDIDASLSEEIDDALSRANVSIIQAVDNYIEQTMKSLFEDQGTSELSNTMQAPFYHPKDVRVYFTQHSMSIALSRERETLSRRATACAIARLAMTNWEHLP